MKFQYSLQELGQLAGIVCNSLACPRVKVNHQWQNIDQNTAITVMQWGQELGLAPIMALNKVTITTNGLSLTSEAMQSLIRSQGHIIETVEKTDQRCVLKGTRADDGTEHTAMFTMEEATRAGLTEQRGKHPNQYHVRPQVMLFHRAMSKLAREAFADAINGISYTPEELEEIAATQAAEGTQNEPEPAAEPSEEERAQQECRDALGGLYKQAKAASPDVAARLKGEIETRGGIAGIVADGDWTDTLAALTDLVGQWVTETVQPPTEAPQQGSQDGGQDG